MNRIQLAPDDPYWWDDLETQFRSIYADLCTVRFEEKSEAMKPGTPGHDPTSIRQPADPNLILYRGTDAPIELPAVVEQARRLADEAGPLIRERALSPKLLRVWGGLQYAHGLLMAANLATGQDLRLPRAAQKGGAANTKEPQLIWAARFLKLRIDAGMTLKAAQHELQKYVATMARRNDLSEPFPSRWYALMLRTAGKNPPLPVLTKMFSRDLTKSLIAHRCETGAGHVLPDVPQ